MSKQEDKFWKVVYGEMQDEVSNYIKEHRADQLDDGDYQNLVLFSAWPNDYSNNLHEVAVEGRVRFGQDYDPFWGEGTVYHSDVVENPTWLEVALLANDMINTVGDSHHVFLEAVNLDKSFGVDEEFFIKHYRFSMGS